MVLEHYPCKHVEPNLHLEKMHNSQKTKQLELSKQSYLIFNNFITHNKLDYFSIY